MAQKPSIPKGTRDFSPAEMMRRQYIFDTIRRVFRSYGFAPLEDRKSTRLNYSHLKLSRMQSSA